MLPMVSNVTELSEAKLIDEVELELKERKIKVKTTARSFNRNSSGSLNLGIFSKKL